MSLKALFDAEALDLLEFIHESPTNFHAVLSIKQRLQAHGFKQLFSGEAWHIDDHFLPTLN